MAYEVKPGDGSLFKNERRASDNHPHATGYIVAHRDIRAGERVRLAAWTKEGRNGKWQSLRMSDEQRREDSAPQPPAEDEAPW